MRSFSLVVLDDVCCFCHPLPAKPYAVKYSGRVHLTTPCSFFTPHLSQGHKAELGGILGISMDTQEVWLLLQNPEGIFLTKMKTQVLSFFPPSCKLPVKCQFFPPNCVEWCEVDKVKIYQYILVTFQCCVQSQRFNKYSLSTFFV